jgi:hypothetical protein
MRSIHQTLFCLLVIVTGAMQLYGGEVVSSGKRQATLDLASQLLTVRKNPASELPDDLTNPFNPGVKAADNQKPTRTPSSSDRDVLVKIASTIAPSGMMMFGGRPLLMLREKKLRVGDSLKLNLDGFDYIVVITAIDPTSFRLRLNREEITRPIKPGKIP